MNRYSGRLQRAARPLIAVTLALVLSPAAGTFAQNAAERAPATENAGTSAEAATEPQNAHARRRAARVEASQARQRADAARAAAKGKNGEAEIVCKSIKPTGSNVGRRVCGTPEEWAALEDKTTEAAREDMRRVHTQGGVIATQPGPATTP